MRPAEFAGVTGQNVETVRRKCARGELPARKCGRAWLIRAREALGMEEKDGEKGKDAAQ